MRNLVLSAAVLSLFSVPAKTQSYPAIGDYMMSRDAEIALAKSAAPVNISDHATVKVLTASGYQVAREGGNGFVCMVLRGWAAPTYTPAQLRDLVYDAKTRAPICFDPKASQIVMPYYELRSKLAMQGETPDHIAEQVQAAYVKGQLPQRVRRELWIHVVGRPNPWTGCSLAPPHDVIPPLCQKP
jgi:hypothetical protein